MSRISVRGFAVASATAVTTVGAVVGVASGDTLPSNDNLETSAADMTLLADIPMGEQAQVQVSSLAQQADAQAAAADDTARKSAEEAARTQAAKAALDKKEAADDKAAADRAAAQARASRDAASDTIGDTTSFTQQASYTVAEVKAIARQIIPADQFQCFSNIVDHESTWNYRAQNPSSGAYGLVQAYPGSKMSSVGDDWRTNPATQIKWGLKYMNERYDSPCGAWEFWQANKSY